MDLNKIKSGLTYQEACNHMLVGLGDATMYCGDTGTLVVPNKNGNRCVEFSSQSAYICDCGCKENREWDIFVGDIPKKGE